MQNPNSSTPSGLLDLIRQRRNESTRRTPGDIPGSLVYEGLERSYQATLAVTDYSKEHLHREPHTTVTEGARFLENDNPTWFHFTGVHEVEHVSQLGELAKIPPLRLEDILHTNTRPKIEADDDAVFIQLKILEPAATEGELDFQQLSIYLTPKAVFTFCEIPSRIFAPLQRRLDRAQGRLRSSGTDYLLWAILDTVIDHALNSLQILEEDLLDLDDLIQHNPNAISPADLYSLKHEISTILGAMRPTREIIHSLRQTNIEIISEDLDPFLGDLHDHSLTLLDECEALRDYASGIREYLLTELDKNMNNTMKILASISTIFLPLTFLAGIYGMNFVHMPELNNRFAYPVFWIIVLTLGLLLFWYFRKRRWI